MLSESQKISAIVKKAKEIETSYGAFAATLSKEDEQRLYDEYERELQVKIDKQSAKCTKKRK